MTEQATGVQAATARVKVMPEKYDGTTDFSLWIEQFNLCAAANDWDDEQQLILLPTFLKDDAFLMYMGFADDDKSTKKKLVERLTKAFRPPERARACMNEFLTRNKQRDETFEHYVYDLKQMLNQAVPALDASARDTLLMTQFVNGLPLSLYKDVIKSSPDSLTKAISSAKQCEALNSLARKRTDRQVDAVNGGSVDPVQQLRTELTQLRKDFSDAGSKWRKSGKGFKKGKGDKDLPSRTVDGKPICFYCRKVGHLKRNCLKLQAKQKEQLNEGQEN